MSKSLPSRCFRCNNIFPTRLLNFVCVFFAATLLTLSVRAQIITTVAGNGTPGMTGDGGPATAAEIYYNWSVASDGAGGFYLGTYYFSGSGYARIRRVNAADTIATYAGNGTPGFSGDGGQATAAEIGGTVSGGFWGGGVASDAAGNLYINDAGNYRIRKVNASTGVITTIAGNGGTGYTGDGGPATAAALGNYWGGGAYGNNIASDPYGNVYIYCWNYYKIRKIDTAGIITTIAGTGAVEWPTFSGDGVAATAAALYYVFGLAADGSGNVYISDYEFSRVRMINSSGIINTIAGNGATGYTGDGGAATAAQNGWPRGLGVDGAGNLYIADLEYNRVRKVDPSGIISTVAGTGAIPGSFSGDGGPATAATLYYPIAVCTEAGGNVYISDYYNYRIRKIINYNRPPRFVNRPSTHLTVCENSAPDSINTLLAVMDSDMYQAETWAVLTSPSHGTLAGAYTTVSTGSVMTPHGLSYKPNTGYSGLDTFKETVCDGYAFDTLTVYVTVNPVPSAIVGATSMSVGGYSILGSSPPGGTWSSGSSSIAPVSGTGMVTGASTGNTAIVYTLPTGCSATVSVNVFAFAGQMISTIAGNGTAGSTGDGASALSAELHAPWGSAVDASGNVYIADAANNKIRKVTPSGVITTIAGTGTAGFGGDGGAAATATISFPYDVAVDAAGNIYIADDGNNRVRKINTSGIITTIAGNGSPGYSGDGGQATAASFTGPSCIAVDGTGNIYLSVDGTRIRKINTAGIISTFAGNGTAGYTGDGLAATAEELNNPVSVAVDGSGNVYIADQQNNRIRKVNTSGIISTIAGTGTPGYSGDGGSAATATIHNPWGIATDALGNIYIGDQPNNRVRRINTSGIINTIAGNGIPGYAGDACAATSGELNQPAGLAVDGSGQVYIADLSNNRVRRISNNHAPAFLVGHSIPTSVCENSTDSLNPILSVLDVDQGQGETWSVITAATHGTVSASYTTTSTGGVMVPTGLYYTPTPGYTGLDSFKVQVSDCGIGSDTATVHVTVTLPPSTITGASNVCPGLTTLLSDPPGTGTWSSSDGTKATVASTGLVTGVAAGAVTITYSPGAGCSVTKPMTVNAAPVAVGGPAFVCLGQTVTLTDGTSGGAWSTTSSLVSVVGSTGVVSGLSLGLATVTYTQSGCIATKTISVNAQPLPITGPSTLCAESADELYDVGTGVWTSGSPSIATIDPSTGVATGVAAGNATLTYTLAGGCTATFVLTVYPLPSAITGPDSVCVGSTMTLSDTTAGGYWTSSGLGSTPGTVDPASGVVMGITAGTATISYTIGTCSATMNVQVNSPAGSITGGNVVCAGGTLNLFDGGGVWSSASPGIATVDSTGLVTGVASGTAVISYASSNGCAVMDTVTVNPPAPAISGTLHTCIGLTTALSDPGSPGGTWASSARFSVGSVDAITGIVTGIGPGTTTITYTTLTGCTVTAIVTVNNTPGLITGTPKVCVGLTTALGDGVSGGTWTSSAPLTGSISSTGVVSGLIAGTTNVTYSLGAGCTASVVVTVNNLPTVIGGTPQVCVGSTTALSSSPSGGAWTSSAPGTGTVSTLGVVTGIAGLGTTVITYTQNTCPRTVTVTVNPIPALISGPSVVCPGTTITLGDGTPGGVWASIPAGTASIGTSGILTGGTAGTATVSYTLATSCARTKLVTVNPLPSAISGGDSVCVGGTLALTDVGGGTWSTTSSYASVNSTSGVVTGISAGNAMITYTIGTGCYVTKIVTVNALPSAISGPSAVCAGATMTLTDGGGGRWVSTVPATATIGSTSGIVTGIVTGTTTINYTLSTGCATNMTVTVSNAPTAIVGSSTVCAGATTNLSDTVGGGSWTSSATTSATVGSLSGIVTGVTAGTTTTITYSLGSGCTMTKTMTVLASPAGITGTLSVCQGLTTTLHDVTSGGAWSSSLSTTASVTGGVVTGVAAGTAVISYTAAGCPALATVTVNPSPTPITGPTNVCIGGTVTEGNTLPAGTWTTLSGLIITIGSSSGDVTGLSSGPAAITYTVGSCNATRTVSVNAVGTIGGATGLCTGTTTTLTDVGGGTWQSTTPAVATIGSSSGVVSGIAAGTSVITYTLGSGCNTTTTVTVSAGPSPIGGATHVCAGQMGTLTDTAGGGTWSITPTSIATIGSSTGVVTGGIPGAATATYSLGSGCTTTTPVIVNASPAAIGGPSQVCQTSAITLTETTGGGVWSSTGATVSGSGVVTGTALGTTIVSYTISTGCAATHAVTVNPLPGAITGGGSVCTGQPLPLSDTSAGGTWTSSPSTIAAVGSVTGVVTGGTAGTATIFYTLPTGCRTTTPVAVTGGPASISGSSMACIGYTTILTDPTPGGTWSSDAPPTLSVSPTGAITGGTAGTATVSYTLGGCAMTKVVTVNPLPSAITGGPGLCLSSNMLFSDGTPGGTWTSSNPVVAIADPTTGNITGASAGSVTITYSLGPGCNATTPVTVHALPGAIGGPSNLCVGTTATLTETVSGGTWSSTNGVVAGITPAGVVSALSNGTDTILYTDATTGCAAQHAISAITVPDIMVGASMCAWGDTMAVSDSFPSYGLFSSTSVTVANLGHGHGLLSSHAPGIATVTYTVPAGCSITSTLTVNPLPASITGNMQVCAGLSSALSDASTGGTWSSGSTGVSVASTTGVVTGVTTGTATITYTLATGCKTDTMVVVTTPPSALAGTAQMCAGSTTTFTDTATGGIWSSDNATVASVSGGTVAGLSAGTATISYTMGAGCAASRVVTVNALPETFIITGGGSYCAGGTGVDVWLSGSQAGINYQLYRGVTTIGTAVSGTGPALDFGPQSTAGIYTITATDAVSSCTLSMTGTTSISISPLPALYTVTGGGNYCAGGTGSDIGLSGSVPGTSYQLYAGTATSGAAVTGTGAALDFGLRTAAGSYTVKATTTATTCQSTMPDVITVGITPTVTPSISVASAEGDTVCQGSTADFATTESNGGSGPLYTWKVNGSAVSGGAGYSYAPANNDVVSVVMTSSAPCATPATVEADVTMNVLPQVVPTVDVTANPGTSISTGESVTFTATVSNGGLFPTYQWEVNTAAVSGATNITYTTTNLGNGDKVSCIVTSSGQCGGNSSNASVTMTVGNVGVRNINGQQQQWTVQPNPSKGTFLVTGTLGSNTDQQVTLLVTDMLGQEVYRNAATATGGKLSHQISLGSGIANGMYLLSVQTDEGSNVFHIVVEN